MSEDFKERTVKFAKPQKNIYVQNGFIYIRLPYMHRDWCRSLPGRRWIESQRVWQCPATPIVAHTIYAGLGNIYAALDQSFIDLVDEYNFALVADITKYASNLPAVENMKTAPMLHQRQAYWYALRKSGCLLEMGMGTGKTWVALALIGNLRMSRVLVVCPKSVIPVWQAEFDKHSLYCSRVVTLIDGSVQDKAVRAAVALIDSSPVILPLILVVNYESVWRNPMHDLVLNNKWNMVVLDESQRAKAPGGKASMFLSHLRNRCDKRLLLSGTPMDDKPLDIYAQFRFLDPGVFGTSYSTFKSRYVDEDRYGGVRNYRNQDELRDKYRSVTFQVSRDVLDLPMSMSTERFCDLPDGEAKRIYKNLERDYFAWIKEGSEVTPANALVKLLRLHQLAGGHITDDAGIQTIIHRAKQDLLRDVLANEIPSAEPVVVFANFRQDLEFIRELAPSVQRSVGELSGSRNDLEKWQQGNINLLAVQIRTGSLGIDLTRAAYCIYYSVSFSRGSYAQSLARVHRPGQMRSVLNIHLITRGTVDRKIYRILAQKKEVIDSIIGEMEYTDVDVAL